MADFTYVPHDPPHRPFRKGDKVIVLDSQGMELSARTITRTGVGGVTTDCGRCWERDGRWQSADGVAYPFPTIKHAEK